MVDGLLGGNWLINGELDHFSSVCMCTVGSNIPVMDALTNAMAYKKLDMA